MNAHQLLNIERAIEKFFYKVRYNIALHNVLRSEDYRKFEAKIESALKKQIIYFAKVQNINNIVVLEKQDEDFTERVNSKWEDITNFIDENYVYLFLLGVAIGSEKTIVNTLPFEGQGIVQSDIFLEKLQKRATQTLIDIDNTTKEWVTRAINKGVNSGASHYDIARQMHKLADAVSEYRAGTITEQEAAYVIGAMTFDIYRKNNIQYIRLVTSMDEKVCQECNGDESVGPIKLGSAFPSGAKTTPIHINCRCFILPVM